MINNIKKYTRKFVKFAKKIQKPFINWINSLPFMLRMFFGLVCGILGMVGTINPLIPAWFFLPVARQIFFSQKKEIARLTVDFKQKSVRFIAKKRQKIIRKTKKLGNASLYTQYTYRQRLHSLLRINE